VLANPTKLSSRRGATGHEDSSSSEPQAPPTHTRYRRVGLASLLVLIVAGSLLFSYVHRPANGAAPDSPPGLDLTIEDPTGQAMNRFYSALNATLTKSNNNGQPAVTRILHYGDSHVAADIFTGSLRRHFTADFGSAGPGYIVPGLAWYSRAGVVSGSSSGWHVDGLAQPDTSTDGRLGIAGVALSTTQPDQRLWLSAECSTFDLYLLRQPGGGRIQVSLDGATYEVVSLKSDRASPFYVRVASNTRDRHAVEIRSIESGLVKVMGIAVELDGPGVVYDALGINGARATRPLSWDWDILASSLGRRHPDLIVLSYGTNEAGDQDLDLDGYRKRYSEVISRFHSAAPGASILVMAPPDRARRMGNRWVSIPAMARLVSAQREAAFSSGAAFCDLYDEMGGPGSIENWAAAGRGLAGPDRVHLTRAGYHVVADALYHGLEGAYLRSVWQAFGRAIRPFFDFKQTDRTGSPRKRRRVSLPGGRIECNTPASYTLHFS
jgi:lysophospholipase L1-like esterase